MGHGNGINYLGHLARDSARFAAALRGTPARAPVPSCPGWNADDLLWHRPPVGPVARSGDEGVLGRFEETIASGVN